MDIAIVGMLMLRTFWKLEKTILGPREDGCYGLILFTTGPFSESDQES